MPCAASASTVLPSEFVDYYSSLNILGDSTLIIAIYFRKQIHNIIPLLELAFHNIICTEADIRHPMPANELANHFNVNHSVHIIRNPVSAIKKGLDNLTCDGGLAIIGTHHFGPSIEKIFKISFDSL